MGRRWLPVQPIRRRRIGASPNGQPHDHHPDLWRDKSPVAGRPDRDYIPLPRPIARRGLANEPALPRFRFRGRIIQQPAFDRGMDNDNDSDSPKSPTWRITIIVSGGSAARAAAAICKSGLVRSQGAKPGTGGDKVIRHTSCPAIGRSTWSAARSLRTAPRAGPPRIRSCAAVPDTSHCPSSPPRAPMRRRSKTPPSIPETGSSARPPDARCAHARSPPCRSAPWTDLPQTPIGPEQPSAKRKATSPTRNSS